MQGNIEINNVCAVYRMYRWLKILSLLQCLINDISFHIEGVSGDFLVQNYFMLHDKMYGK